MSQKNLESWASAGIVTVVVIGSGAFIDSAQLSAGWPLKKFFGMDLDIS